MNQLRSFRSHPTVAAAGGLLVAAAATVPFVFLDRQATRIGLAVLISLAVALAAALISVRFRRAQSERSAERRRTREELEQSERQRRDLVDALPLVTWHHAADDRKKTRFVSPQIETMLGYSAAQWQAEPNLFSKLLHPEDRERVLSEIEAADKNGTPLQSEYRLLAQNGRVVWVREHGSTVRSSEAEPLYGQSFLIDIGERKRADEERERLLAAERDAISARAERQRRLDLLREAGEIAVTSLDYRAAVQRITELLVRDFADWCVVDVNEEGNPLKRLAVARAEPLRGRAGAAPAQQPEDAVRAVVESGQPRVVPPLGDGSGASSEESGAFLGEVGARSVICAPIRARNRPLGAITLARTEPGERYGADELAFTEDLAARIGLTVDRARLYLEAEERADAARVLAHVADGVALLDRSGIVRVWNRAAEAITSIAAGDAIGRPAAEAISGWKDVGDSVPVSASPDPGHAEVVVPIDTERGERWIAISGVQFFGGTVYAFRDLTEARQLEELKADFIATASHELRTPLAAVYGAAQTLLRHDFALDEGGRDRFVSLIAEESERLGRIVNEILLANQLDAGRLDLQPEPFDAVELVERVVEATRAYAPAGLSFGLATKDGLPRVDADRDKVRQVLVNLVENAIKYSPDGGRIEVGVEARDDSARFYVRDEGLGIPAEEQVRVFEKFYRLDPEMTRGVGGTGLGLYICNELVSRMGGRIWVESSTGKGSTFFFELPTATAGAAPRPVAERLPRSESITSS